MKRLQFVAVVALTAWLALPAAADVGPPAHLQITEREPGLYSVQWRVPTVLPPRAVPSPELPETCRPTSDRRVTDQPGAWLLEREWRCDAGLAGHAVGMRYRFPDLALTTVVRVDLLSGDRFAHVLTPGEGPWQLPEGTAAPDLLRDARRSLLAGVSHVAGSWAHLAFLIVVGLLGGMRQPLRVVTAFTLGQVAGALCAALGPGGIGAGLAETGLALSVALLARELLRPAEERRRLATLAAIAGLAHGLGLAALLGGSLGDDAARLVVQLLAILGIDVAHLVGAAAVVAVWTASERGSMAPGVQNGLAYACGAAGVALAIGSALGDGLVEPGAAAASIVMSDRSAAGPTAGVAGSRRVAPAVPDAPVQSYLAVEPFEVRHEAMLRLAGLTEELGLDPAAMLAVAAQPAVAKRLERFVLDRTVVQVEGRPLPGRVRRADFMTVDPTGALPRVNPVPENVSDAVVGVIVSYPTDGMPGEVSLRWEAFPNAKSTIPATVIDPESVTSAELSAEEPALIWRNALVEDPIPTVDAVEVEPLTLPVPLLSLPLLVLAVALPVAGMRRKQAPGALAATRVILAVALAMGPLAQTAVAVPGSAGRVPSDRQARRILSGLLPNVYRAMEYRDEALIYDRLAVSVVGEALTEVYLEQRRALEIEERGGARARVEAVEILEARDIVSDDRGFGVRAIWTVGGMVTHFGHRHFRQNRYDASIGIVPADGTWKIRSVEVLEQERLK